MALTLDPTLQAAQNGQSHNPICRIISSKFVSSIPFTGNYFNTETATEQYPALIETASGRLALVFSGTTALYYKYSDTDKLEFFDVTLVTGVTAMYEATLVEMDDCLGVIFTARVSNNILLRYMTISETGTILTGPTTIASYAYADYQVREVHVIRLVSGEYLLTYRKTEFGSDDDHYLMTRTCDNASDDGFDTWSEEAALTLSGLDPDRRKSNPCTVQVANGDVLLFFDYVTHDGGDAEINNIYFCGSSDDGVTFSAPAAITSEVSYGRKYLHPSAAVNALNQITLSYHLESNVLTVTKDMPGMCGVNGELTWWGTNHHFDPATNKLFLQNSYATGGTKTLRSVIVIDVETWTVEKCYSSSSSPAYNSVFAENHVWWDKNHGDGQYAVASTWGGSHVMVIDHSTQTITTYSFRNDAQYGLTKNIPINWRWWGSELYAGIHTVWIDAEAQRLYVVLKFTYNDNWVWIGYINLTETADPHTGMYTWHEILFEVMDKWNGLPFYTLYSLDSVTAVKEVDMIMIACSASIRDWRGALLLYSLSSGALIKKFYVYDTPEFHYRGCYQPAYYDGHIYAGFVYESGYDQADRRGLMDIDLSDYSITYITPTYAAGVNDYRINQIKPTGDGRLIITTNGYGIVIYDIDSGVWTQYDMTSLPGLPTNSWADVDYDPSTGNIFVGTRQYPGWRGWAMFNIYGAYAQVKYRIGEEVVDWEFSGEGRLVQALLDSEATITRSAVDELWAVWTRLDLPTEKSLKWDREEAERDLSEFITGPVTAAWDVASPNKLSLSLSHGHLFDPFNLNSLLSPTTRKGRKLTLEFGEKIGGVNSWQNQGAFIVLETSLSHKRGDYPVISVRCEDITALWKDVSVTATQYYTGAASLYGYLGDTGDPLYIVEDLVTVHGNLSALQTDLPATLDNTHSISHQWIDTKLSEALKDLLDHFGYFPFVDVDGKFTVKRVNLGASASHVYSNLLSIINFSPDDSYSTLVNRVIVKGEGNYFIEVTFAEECRATESGTMGWWGCEEVKRIYFSEDRQLQCRNVRLNITERPTTNVWFLKKSSGSIAVIGLDSDGYYVEVLIVAPNHVMTFTIVAALFLATAALAIFCDTKALGPFTFIPGTCGHFILATSILASIVMYLLGMVANYAFEIWGRPVGRERQTFQAQADDLDLQREMDGMIVKAEIDDPFCYTAAICKQVADRELAVVQAQRQRLRFDKIAHLQDEVSDVVRVVHPYTGRNMDIFIATLTRTYQKPDSERGGGGMTDSIEGWLLT